MFIRQDLSDDQIKDFKEKLKNLNDLACMVQDYNVAMTLISTMTREEIYHYSVSKQVLHNNVTYGITQL